MTSMHHLSITRTRALQAYLTTITLAVIAFAFSGTLSVSSAVLAAGLLFAPAIIAFRMWPDASPETAMDVMRRR